MSVPNDPPRPPRLSPGEGDRAFAVAGDIYMRLVSGEDTGGAYCLHEGIVPAGGGPPPHVHTREEEGFHVLEGAFTFLLGDREVRLGPGQTANVPRGTVHSFRGEAPGPSRMLILNVPAGLDRYFEIVGTPVEGRHAQAPPLSPEEVERLMAAAPEFGIEFPPPA